MTDEPNAVKMTRAVRKRNCAIILKDSAVRIKHFKRRIAELGMTPNNGVIVLLNVDDPHGGPLAELLMPGHNWQEYRDNGLVPVARGIAEREGIQLALHSFDKEAAAKLLKMNEVAVVVVDHGVAEIFMA